MLAATMRNAALMLLVDMLKIYAPLLLFIGVRVYLMRRYSTQSSQWTHAARDLEGIEKHLARTFWR